MTFLQICISVNYLLIFYLDVNTIIPLTLILTLEELCLRQLFRAVILSDCLEDNVNKRVSVVVTSFIHNARRLNLCKYCMSMNSWSILFSKLLYPLTYGMLYLFS